MAIMSLGPMVPGTDAGDALKPALNAFDLAFDGRDPQQRSEVVSGQGDVVGNETEALAASHPTTNGAAPQPDESCRGCAGGRAPVKR